ncbi:MAG: hypothetical protein IJ035_00945 [Oscillospiraceae bacterium]|nr:hypothetical protein [Oscillospiraceae bacterium]
MVCPNCGKEYNEKMTCCISCGADLIPAEENEEVSEPELISDEISLIPPIIPEEVSAFTPAYSAAAASFESVEVSVPIKHINRQKVLSNAIRVAGSFITAAVMFALIALSAAAAGFRFATDEKRIAEFAETLDVMALPAEQFNGSDGVIQDAVFAMSQGTGLTRDNIRTIYENSTAKDFLATQLSGYADFIRNGTMPEQLTTEQLKNVFKENLPLIDSTLGQPLNDHDIALAQSEIERARPLLEMLSHENLEKTIGEDTIAVLRLFGSVPAIAVTAALAVSMMIVLRAINKKSRKVLNWGGGTILAGGAAVLAATFVFSLQLPYANTDRLLRAVIKCACDVISPDMYHIGAALAAVGAIMLLWADSLRRSELKN